MTTFEEAFEATGHGLFNHVVTLTCGLILLYTMMESLGVGYIITAAECELGLTLNEKGLINAAAFIGIVITAIFWGYLSDRYGRRAVMMPSIALGTVFSFSSSLSNNFATMFVLRFLTGCLVSSSSATVFAYLGEMHTDSRRSEAIAFGSTFIAISFIILSVLAWVILTGTWSFYLGSISIGPWRTFVWSWSAPGLVAVIFMLFLPESPRFLYAVKGQEKALPVLARIYARNHRNKTKEDYPVKTITKMTAAMAQRGFCKAIASFGQLLRPPLRRCMLISHFSMFMVFMLSSGLYTWMPVILHEMLNNIHSSKDLCHIMMDRYTGNKGCNAVQMNPLMYPVSMFMGTLCAVTYISSGYIMRKHSKIGIYCTLLGAGAIMLLLSAVLPHPGVSITLFSIGLCCGCSASILAAIAVEVFPTNVRSLALCTLYMAGRTGAAFGANIIGLGLGNHCIVVFCICTILSGGSILLMILWPDPKAVRTIMEERGYAY